MSQFRERLFVAVAVIVLCGSCIIAPVGATSPRQTSTAETPAALQDDPSNELVGTDHPATDSTVTRIVVHEDGSATWMLSVRTRLDTDQRVEEYEEFQTRFRAEQDERTAEFSQRMEGVVANAAETTGREMAATEFSTSTSIQEVPRRWGVVTYSFHWDGFGTVDEGDVVVGDVFAGGFFLESEDTLIIEPPDGYTHTSAAPPPDETDGDALTWQGREDFADGNPSVRFVEADDGGDTETAPTETNGDRLHWVAIGIAVLVLVAGGAFVLARREKGANESGLRERIGSARSAIRMSSGDPGSTGPPTADTADSNLDGDDSNDPDTDGGETNDPDSVPGTAATPVTDEDRVRTVLDEHNGRLKQSVIADELDWSASKTSRVLSGMEESGDVEKLRIGRENVIDLADRDDAT